MIKYGTRLIVDQNDYRNTRSISSSSPTLEDLNDGQVLLKIGDWAYTSNNTTYAVVGHMIGYWKFFPVEEEGYGIIPCWGFADVVASNAEGVTVGDRVYGYFPMASHLIVEPVNVSPNGFIDGAAHRAQLPVIYNQYTQCANDPLYHKDAESLQALYRPLFTTSFLIRDLFEQESFFGSKQVVVTSASSKTAMSLAFCLKDDPVEVIGLTSPSNVENVVNSGLYDQVYSYDDFKNIPEGASSIVDFAGNHKLLFDVEHHLMPNLKYVCLVGFVHWESDKAEEKLPLKGIMFFAPSYAAERVKQLGPAEFNRRLATKYMSFIQSVKDKISIVRHNGIEALASFHQKITDGDLNANEGHIIKL